MKQIDNGEEIGESLNSSFQSEDSETEDLRDLKLDEYDPAEHNSFIEEEQNSFLLGLKEIEESLESNFNSEDTELDEFQDKMNESIMLL